MDADDLVIIENELSMAIETERSEHPLPSSVKPRLKMEDHIALSSDPKTPGYLSPGARGRGSSGRTRPISGGFSRSIFPPSNPFPIGCPQEQDRPPLITQFLHGIPYRIRPDCYGNQNGGPQFSPPVSIECTMLERY
jgi:hypothetical protein